MTTSNKNESKKLGCPLEALVDIRKLKAKNDWEGIVAHADEVPWPLTREWLEVVDEVAFALGHLGARDQAVNLYQETFAMEETARRASALAYLFYDALLLRNGPQRNSPEVRRRDKEADRAAFLKWVERAMELNPVSIKDMYRLGVYEAQVQSKHDKVALRWFRKAIDIYRSMEPEKRRSRGYLFKPYVKSLYAAARSAMRLKRVEEARRHIFSCIREDKDSDHVAPVFKLFLAGKVCAALDRFEDAERAFRLALDAKGPPNRRFVYVALARLFLKGGFPKEARVWIEEHVPPYKRTAWIWRLLGDIHRELGHVEEARKAYENAAKKDRAGRHLTLRCLGDLQLEAGRPGKARKLYEQADKFKKRKYLSHDKGSIKGLLCLAKERGDEARVAELSQILEEMEGQGSEAPDVHARPMPPLPDAPLVGVVGAPAGSGDMGGDMGGEGGGEGGGERSGERSGAKENGKE